MTDNKILKLISESKGHAIAGIQNQDPEKLLLNAVMLIRKIQDEINKYAKNIQNQSL